MSKSTEELRHIVSETLMDACNKTRALTLISRIEESIDEIATALVGVGHAMENSSDRSMRSAGRQIIQSLGQS